MDGSMDNEDGGQGVVGRGVVWWGGEGWGVVRTESLGVSIPSFKE